MHLFFFNLYTCNVHKNYFFKIFKIEFIRIKMFEIHNNYVYDIFHEKTYLDTKKSQ